MKQRRRSPRARVATEATGWKWPDTSLTPSRAAYGAVSFEISPSYADLYVDGQLIGRVGDFTPNHPPLTLSPGSHQVEVVAEGYEPLAFEVHVVPGQVVPYRGEMRPY